ncbi:MAG: family 20 glycosylhydrolase [Oscillospiraceae bacterium]|nr:family 20 glycosylhydrolase [Oscillospiraceae bacterium]
MKIGKLNELLDIIDFSYSYTGTSIVPQAEFSGNPVEGHLLQLNWNVIGDQDVTLCLKLPKPCYVDTVELQLGAKPSLRSAAVYCGNQLLYRHTAETGKNITDQLLTLEANTLCQSLEIVLCSDFAHLKVEGITLYGALDEGIDLFPTPNTIQVTGADISLTSFTGCTAESSDEKRAAEILCEKFREKSGLPLSESSGNIRFITNSSLPADGYELEVDTQGAKIQAANLRGFVSGAETFIKLLGDKTVPSVKISDSPFKSFRGVHLFIPSEEQMDFAKRLIKYIISPMGYNTVILQVSGGMIYERHPKISEAFAHAVEMNKHGWPAFPHNGIAEGKPITKEMLKDYIHYIRSFGIDVIPEVQSLAHVQYLTIAYPEIAEIAADEATEAVDTRIEDMLPSQFYRHDYCPSNPRSYEILFDVIDEIIEVFEPREFVHMGHDEVRTIGACPICKKKTPAQLFAEDVCKIHDYLASKGLRMMIWADMLQPVTKYQTPEAINMIPKDIVMLDFIWYFHLTKDIEDNLLEKGFDVMIGNLYSSHFPRYESRIRKPGIHGGQISAWVATNEEALQQEGKLYDLLLTAQLLWAERYHHNFRLCYDRILRRIITQLRQQLQHISYPSLQRSAQRVLLAETPGDTVQVNGQYDSIIFSHAAKRRITRQPWTKLDVVANYNIRYADGTTEKVPVTYGGNVGYFNRRQNAPLPHPTYRHTGYTAVWYCDSETVVNPQGEPETLYIYEYIPTRKAPIAAITLEQNPDFDAKVFLGRLEGIKL